MKLWSLYRVDSAMVEGCIAGVVGGYEMVWKKKKNSVKARYRAGHSQPSVDSFALYCLARSYCV